MTKDKLAIALAATFIWGPFTVQPITHFIEAYWQAGCAPQNPSVVLGWLTFAVLVFQAWIFWLQTKISDKVATLTHQTYLTANRPRLRIRNFVVHRTRNGNRDQNARLFEDHNIAGQCYLTNIGGTDARVVESHLIAFAAQMGLPMERPYEGREPNNPVGPIKIEAGKSHPIPFFEVNPLVTGTGEPERARVGDHPIFIMGWISYSDDNGTTRRTAFCRQWDGRKSRFVRLEDDPDYEHEE